MKIYTALQIGAYHTNHCEDFLFYGDIGKNKTLCAIMDGCTMGADSYFASTLVGKILNKIVKERSYKEFYNIEADADPDSSLRSILKELFKELNIVRNQLLLDQKELLTTLIIVLLDKKENGGIVLAIGDGLVSINGSLHEFEQDNKPDYLGFHLNEDFESWYDKQSQKIAFDGISDISIATDGIFTFTPVKKAEAASNEQPIDFLLSDKTDEETEDMLYLKLKKLEHNLGLAPTDDLAIIRIIS